MNWEECSIHVGAQNENARSPYVTEFAVGILRRDLEDKRRVFGWMVFF